MKIKIYNSAVRIKLRRGSRDLRRHLSSARAGVCSPWHLLVQCSRSQLSYAKTKASNFRGRRVEHSRSSRVPINTTTSSLCWCVQQPTVNLWCVRCYTLVRSWNCWLGLGKAQIQAGGSGRGDTGGAYARTLSWRHESWSAVIRPALDLIPLARLCFEVRKTGRVVLHGSS